MPFLVPLQILIRSVLRSLITRQNTEKPTFIFLTLEAFNWPVIINRLGERKNLGESHHKRGDQP